MENERLTKEALEQFNGTDQYWEHKCPFGRLILTDGCNFVRGFNTRWIFDLLMSYQKQLQDEEFQNWKLKRVEGNAFVMICVNGDDLELLRQEVPFSDMILDELTIWLVMEGEERVCLLPSEY